MGARRGTQRATVWSCGLAMLVVAGCSDAGAESSLAMAPRLESRGGAKEDVRALIVSPDQLVLSVGESATLSVSITGRKGPVSPDAAHWTSTDPEIATVDADGRVEGRAGGTTTVIASWRNVSDSATVVVEGDAGGGDDDPPPPPPPGSLVRECDAPASAWIWCDDFETNRLAAYFEHESKGGAFDRAPAVGLEGSSGMRATWQEGQVSIGWMHVAFGRTPSGYFTPVDDGTVDRREIYWRFFLRNDADWSGGGGSKMTRARIFHADEGWVSAMSAPVWSGPPNAPDVVVLDPVSYTDEAGTVTGDARWLGRRVGSNAIFADASVGGWHCIETQVRLNDLGASNGVFRVWIDGVLDAERTGLNWVGAYDDYGINTVTLDNYWNGGAPRAQSRYFDNLVVSTQPIGCG